MDFHDIWKDLVIGIIVGLVLMYQQWKIGRLEDLQDRIESLDKNTVKWPEHEKDIERLEDRHDKALERVMDKLDTMQGEFTNLYKLLLEREK